MAAAHLACFPDHLQSDVMQLAGVLTTAVLTADATDRLGALADAYEIGLLLGEGDQLTAAPDTFTNLVAKHGGSKKAVIDTAKQAAKELGLARPTSSTQVEASLMLLAATSMQAITPNPNTGDI
jgi:hypothetical protein